jgi:hypothetical protein
MRDRGISAAAWIGAWAAVVVLTAVPNAVASPPANDVPNLYLTWHAPYGDPRARTTLAVDCRDTTGVDVLYLTFETRRQGMRFTGMSGTLVFEPQMGDTLGSYWFRARGEANQAKTFVDFEYFNSETADTPWESRAVGSVGFGHVGGRGRLDMSAHVPPQQAKNLFPGTRYVVARIKLMRSNGHLPGCDQPMSIAMEAACLYTTLGRTWIPPGLGHRVTMNAEREGVATGRFRPVAVWVPRFAPPSWRTVELGFEPDPPESPHE